jgi:hypothetical protein
VDRLGEREWRQLLEHEEPQSVSVYLPTHRSGYENQQDPLRLRNLLDEAEEALVARGMRSTDARRRLEAGRRLVDDSAFWREQADGLTLLVSAAQTRRLRLPMEMPERVVVDDCFYLVPLLPLAARNARYYILSVSPKQVRLLEAAGFQVAEREVPNMPTNLADLARYVEAERHLQFHTGAPPAHGGRDRAAIFHGQGTPDEEAEHKALLGDFCRRVDAAVRKVLAGESAPLILAADKSLAPIYREVNSYDHLVDEPVTGNPDRDKPEELRRQAWPLIEQGLDRRRSEAAKTFEQAAGAGKGSSRLAELLPAAQDGRVGTLLVATDVQVWGRFDAAERQVQIHEKRRTESRELVNLATVLAGRHGAELLDLPASEMPGGAHVAAVFRY